MPDARPLGNTQASGVAMRNIWRRGAVNGGGAAYCATKAAVERFTEALRIDLNPQGIKVGCIDPGMVETEFSKVRFKGDQARAAAVYAGLQPLSADDVAEAIVWMATRPAHVVVADMLLLPLAQASVTVVRRELS